MVLVSVKLSFPVLLRKTKKKLLSLNVLAMYDELSYHTWASKSDLYKTKTCTNWQMQWQVSGREALRENKQIPVGVTVHENKFSIDALCIAQR